MNIIQNYLKEKKENHLNELFSFLSLPSISALPEHKEDINKTAEWLVHSLTQAGLENASIY